MEFGKNIIIGTMHNSRRDAKEVEEVLERERPDILALELCPIRYQALQRKIRRGKGGKIKLGIDMVTAIQKGEELGCKIVPIDQPVQVSLRRCWEKMRFLEKLSFLYTLIRAFLWKRGEKEGEYSEDYLIKKTRYTFPSLATTFIDERDAYMAERLLELNQEGSKIVAVVGRLHVSGIKEHLKKS